MPVEMKYYYHTSDGELHGPAELDFLVREVKWGGLPDSLMVRSENSDEWISLAEVVQGNTSVGWPLDVMSVTPEELARMSRWKRLWYYYRRSWKMAFVLEGRASQQECMHVFLSMTLADCLAFVAAPLLSGLMLAFLFPGKVSESVVFFTGGTIGVLLCLLVVIQSFSLCWRRLHDLSLPGYWVFALPVVSYAGNWLITWLLEHAGILIPRTGMMHYPGISPALAFVAVVSVVVSLVIIVLSLTWIVALLGLFRGMEGENRYGPRPEM